MKLQAGHDATRYQQAQLQAAEGPLPDQGQQVVTLQEEAAVVLQETALACK
jgi:hypothetical protein